MNAPTPQRVAAMFGCTVERVAQQYARNALQLAAMASEADVSGRRVNGYTAEELRARADKMTALAKRALATA